MKNLWIIYEDYNKSDWFNLLSDHGKYIFHLILKYHNDYRRKDIKFRNFVCFFRILIFLVAMCNTIILGIKFNTENNLQVNIGLILSAIITFLTTMVSFFNFEQYWMINKIIFFKLCKIRDYFIFEAKNNQINNEKLDKYLEKLNKIQDKNINYWKKAILKLK